MVYLRRLIKYVYPKPRKKITVVLLVVCFCFIAFYMRQTVHRKAKHPLLNQKYSYTSLHDIAKPDGHKTIDVVSKSDQVDSRVEPTNVYNTLQTEMIRSALVFTGSKSSLTENKLKFVFKSLKINFDFIVWNRFDDYTLSLPRLVDKYQKSRYQAFIYTNEDIFDNFDSYNWNLIKKHCRAFNVGVIVLCNPAQSTSIQSKHLKTLPLSLIYGVDTLEDLEVPDNNVLEKVKSPNVLYGRPPGKAHVVFHSRHTTFKTVLLTNIADDSIRERRDISETLEARITDHKSLYSIEKGPLVLYDTGKIDGVRKFIFGVSFWQFWMYQLLLVDALGVVSGGRLGFGLKRYIQIDIDDIFVGRTGWRLLKEDVDAIKTAQESLSTKIDGFKFKLGYSANRFQLSNISDERDGDAYLMRPDVSRNFNWFCHTSKHIKPHEFSEKELIEDFEANRAFAKEHALNVDYSYAVAPHHSGVYPVHNPLYRAWKAAYGIKVTSTEGYPHLYPAHSRKGFIHKDIMVLPRQTCGLFTKTLSQATHPNGPNFLYESTQGGDLFWTFVFNPVNIYMTHMNNYGLKERLAIPLFTNVTNFIGKWTNLELVHTDPVSMATKYFEIFSKQMEPLWTDPCMDVRHQKIWNKTNTYCKPHLKSPIPRLPDLFILGPQKSGTAAFLTFLSLHNNIVPSRRSNSSYEEVQFFNKNNYKNGIEWYLNYFPATRANENLVYVDKSANYFDSLKAPLRAHSLVPDAKLVVILIDPRLRAYSWYQHIRSKSSGNNFKHSFYDVITSLNLTNDTKLDVLHAKCLMPGRYAESLERWLQYYDQTKLLIVDGDELKERPADTMNKVQSFLGLSPFAFHKHIRYSKKKRFFCVYLGKSYRCLGKGKGRHYPKMTDKEWHFLTQYYSLPNLKLYDLLKALDKPIPKWLQNDQAKRGNRK